MVVVFREGLECTCREKHREKDEGCTRASQPVCRRLTGEELLERALSQRGSKGCAERQIDLLAVDNQEATRVCQEMPPAG